MILFLLLQVPHGEADFRQTHLGDAVGGHAQRVHRLAGIEIQYSPKIIVCEILVSCQPAAYQQHISHAALKCAPVCRLDIEVVQFLQKAACGAVPKLRKVVGHVVLHGVFCRAEQRPGQIVLILQLSKTVFQALDDLRRIGRLHIPQGNRAGQLGFMGIADVKVVLQAHLPIVFVIKHRDTGGSAVDPAPHLPVPIFNFQYRRGVRALGIQQNLLVEAQPVIVTGRAKEAAPVLRAAGYLPDGLGV